MNRILRFILIGFAGLIIFLVLLEVGMRTYKHFMSKNARVSVTNRDNDKVVEPAGEQGHEDGEDTREDLIPSYIFDNTNYFLALIVDKKYAEAYNLLYPEFRSKYFPELGKFTEYCTNNLKGLSKESLNMYGENKLDGNTYVYRVKLKLTPTQSEKSEWEDYFTMYFMNDDKNFNIAMYGFVGTKEVNAAVNLGKVRLNVTKTFRTSENVDILVEMYNGEDQPISILNENSFFDPGEAPVTDKLYMIDENGEKFYYSLGEENLKLNYTVPPNSSATFNLPFYIPNGHKISRLCFDNIIAGQEVRKAEVEIK